MNTAAENTPVIWALIDERPGTGNQCLAVARALELPFVEKKLAWSSFAELPNIMIGASLRGLSASAKSEIKSPWPDLVIAAGRRAGSVARYIKKQSMDDCRLVQIMYPGDTAIADFDLVAVPNHDGPVQGGNEDANIMRVTGAPHNIGEVVLTEAKQQWQATFAEIQSPLIGLVIGGATRRRPFATEMAQRLGEQAGELATKLGASLLVTSSPRTGTALDDVMAGLTAKNIAPAFVYRWSAETAEDDNPYLGFLALADQLIVTGDSTSMCSEACASGKPVHIFAPQNFLGDKHQRLVHELCVNGYAQLIGAESEDADVPKKLDVAGQITTEIKLRLLND